MVKVTKKDIEKLAVKVFRWASENRCGKDFGVFYNGKLKSAEILLHPDGTFDMIRRAETVRDYFATFDFCDILKDAKLD